MALGILSTEQEVIVSVDSMKWDTRNGTCDTTMALAKAFDVMARGSSVFYFFALKIDGVGDYSSDQMDYNS